MRKRVVRIADGHIVSDEAEGVYHLEDGDLRRRQTDRPLTTADAVDPAQANADANGITPHSSVSNGHTRPAPTRPVSDADAAGTISGSGPGSLPPTIEPQLTLTRRPAPSRLLRPQLVKASVVQHDAVRGTPDSFSAPLAVPVPLTDADAPQETDANTPRPATVQAATVAATVQAAEPKTDSLVQNAASNHAPIGSPDNPIVQF